MRFCYQAKKTGMAIAIHDVIHVILLFSLDCTLLHPILHNIRCRFCWVFLLGSIAFAASLHIRKVMARSSRTKTSPFPVSAA